MAEIQVCREQNTDEKIAELAKQIGVAESYIRALIAGTITQTKLRIGTYEDARRVFLELKDTGFASAIANIIAKFIGEADLARKREVFNLMRQSDNVPIMPEETGINEEPVSYAKKLDEEIDKDLEDMLENNKSDGWAIKHIIDNSTKYSKLYNKAVMAIITLRKIKTD